MIKSINVIYEYLMQKMKDWSAAISAWHTVVLIVSLKVSNGIITFLKHSSYSTFESLVG